MLPGGEVTVPAGTWLFRSPGYELRGAVFAQGRGGAFSISPILPKGQDASRAGRDGAIAAGAGGQAQALPAPAVHHQAHHRAKSHPWAAGHGDQQNIWSSIRSTPWLPFNWFHTGSNWFPWELGKGLQGPGAPQVPRQRGCTYRHPQHSH